MSSVMTHEEKQIARPLSVLVPLIHKDLERAKDAIQAAGVPFYRSIGDKLREAQHHLGTGVEFYSWSDRHFNIGRRQTREYINISIKNSGLEAGIGREPMSVRETIRASRPDNPNYGKDASWRSGVRNNIDRARIEAKRIQNENLTRQQERNAEKELALRLIDIGFKVLAKELHPDKGGTRDAMSRLSRVRDRLKSHA